MKIAELIRDKSAVYTIEQDKTLHDAIQVLVQHNIGALPVLDKRGKVIGIISERDILRETAQRADRLHKRRVKDVMTKEVIIGLAEDEVEYTLGVMTQNRIRHLPIMEGDKLVGIISLADAVKARMVEHEMDNRYLKQYMFGELPEEKRA